ncbi:putative D-isomer specific 2-hydroxyacid dehydrogenase-protein [Trypanosoma conorhini]|uniref:Putative D-isomer specific 2-hydroxyacid dehydrogenase-protein n=1 Tax=Trypanosoma conorhini TaxID=83891 RepID=A0A422QAM5_9TRYP|nr:putative D-isomer specific 2-hydroxyacid dehydrogenase-protein [Trypanosoma conorhini]RNF27032.1 putative D-isomer specific 2-hydroxyacid dehydrogenase-protein [Trypanosoma conorhini]
MTSSMESVFDYTLCIAFDVPKPFAEEIIKTVSGPGGFKRVVILKTVPEEDFKEAKQSGEPLVILVARSLGHGAIKYLCDDYHLPKEKRRVRWIHSVSSGLDSYKLHDLLEEVKDIPFTNGRGCYSSILAEHVMYSMLYFYRQTWRSLASRAAHKWDPFNMVELRGRKVGIIGYGDIGQATARLATVFGMEVTGVRRSAPSEKVDKYGALVVSGDAERDRVIRESDFLVNIIPGGERAKQFFNRERFAMMKPSAIYINIGRGTTTNEEDLVRALRDGVIRGAAVDVFEQEPLSSASPLWDISDDKILLTCHSAFMTSDFALRGVECFMSRARLFGSEAFASYAFLVDENFASQHSCLS